MIYASTSIDEVVGRVIRKTRVQDTGFLVDMEEWIPEAMGLMQTKVTMSPAWQDVQISFHAGKMPCRLGILHGVEWNGHRLKYNTGTRTFNAPKQRPSAGTGAKLSGTTPFLTIPYAREVPDEGGLIYDSTAIKLPYCISLDQYSCLPVCEQWYSTSMSGYIQTSFPDGCVRVHYSTIPLDDKGLPLIPNNENYKEAIYWYCRGCMIGAGWEDPVHNFDYCDRKFELHAARAIGQITYPSVDQMEMKVNALTRFIPPAGYFDSFYTTNQPEEFYGDITGIV